MNNQLVSVEKIAAKFGVSVEQLKKQYFNNAVQLEKMYKKAIETGKKVNGFTAEQLKTSYVEFYNKAK